MGRTFVLVLALAALACKSPPAAEPAPPDPAAATAVVQLDEYRARACACTDVQCTLTVAGERTTWLAAQHGLYTFTPEQRAAAATANQAYATCTQPREPDPDAPIRELAALAAEMCACKDKACGEAVVEKLVETGERYKDFVADKRQMDEAKVISERLTQCMSVLQGP